MRSVLPLFTGTDKRLLTELKLSVSQEHSAQRITRCD